jgi:hypothetical protein
MPAPTKVVTNVWGVEKPLELHHTSVASPKTKRINKVFCSGTTIRRRDAEFLRKKRKARLKKRAQRRQREWAFPGTS